MQNDSLIGSESGADTFAWLLERAIGELLTVRQAEIVRAAMFEHLPDRAIAARLDLERSTVSRTRRRGMQRLAAHYKLG